MVTASEVLDSVLYKEEKNVNQTLLFVCVNLVYQIVSFHYLPICLWKVINHFEQENVDEYYHYIRLMDTILNRFS